MNILIIIFVFIIPLLLYLFLSLILFYNNLKKVYKNFLTDVSKFNQHCDSIYNAISKERREITTIYQKIFDLTNSDSHEKTK